MRRLISPLAFPMMLATAMLMAASFTLRAGDEGQKMLRHVVLYKFKDDLKPAQVQEVIDAFAALPKAFDTIAGFEHGTNVSA
ncbi:MAG: Dabb family protein, partial [Pirellulales bacterium]